MKNWLKFFGLSFFSNKIAKDGISRSLANFFCSVILALIFICAGLIGGDYLPFSTHYNRASDFKATVENAFTCQDNAIKISVESGKISVAVGEGDYSQGLKVDTFVSQEDKSVYAKYGYDLVIDTRDAFAYAEFEAFCVSNDNKNTKITYEEYLTLSDVAKYNFEFKLEYLNKQKIITDAMAQDYKTYLLTCGDQVKSKLDSIEQAKSSGELSAQKYNDKIYELYFSVYYPSITAYETTSPVPLVRNYYYHNYVNANKNKFLIIFNDALIGSFFTDKGTEVDFYGTYQKFSNENIPLTSSGADYFIKQSFKSTASFSVYIYVMNVLRLVPFIAIMPVLLALIVNSILKLKGVKTFKAFSGVLKVVGSFTHFAGLFTAILTVILAFLFGRSVLGLVPIIIFFVVLLIRSVILIIDEVVKFNRSEREDTIDTEIEN